ncbi:MAG: PmbA/TldA family metallopeptidase, partial [Acetobacteraceae bacterium]
MTGPAPARLPPAGLLSDLLSAARSAGADAADAMLVAGTSLTLTRRLGRVEHLERAESREVGLRVFVGRRAAIVSSGRVEWAEFPALAERAIAMARAVPEDPHVGIADPAPPAADVVALDLVDPAEPDAALLIERAAAAEEAALAVPGVTNSEGAEASWGRSEVALATSAGFHGSYRRTSHSLSA